MTERRTAWGFLVGGSIAYAALLFAWFSLAAYLAVIVDGLGLSQTEAGLLTGAIPLTYVPVSLFSGPLIDRIGPYRGIAGGMTVVGLAHLGRAEATTFPVMLAFTVLLGVGGTAITFGLPKLVSELFPPDEAGTPSTVYVLGSLAGTTAAFTLGRNVIGPAVGGWRGLFFVTGAACVAFVALWVVAVVLAGPARDTDDVESLNVAGVRRNVARVAASPTMRLLLVIGTVYLMIAHGVQNWLAAVLEARGVAASVASTATGGFVAAQAVGTLALPPLSDRMGRRSTVVAACGVACAAGLGTVVLPNAPLALVAAGVVAAGLGVGGLAPLVRLIPAELDSIGPALTGTAVGLVFAVGELGGFAAPVVVGGLSDLTGSYAPGFAVLSGCCIVLALAGRRLPV